MNHILGVASLHVDLALNIPLTMRGMLGYAFPVGNNACDTTQHPKGTIIARWVL